MLAGLVVGIVLVLAGGIYLIRLSKDLPDFEALADYTPPVMSRVHAGDGTVIAEYARQHRVFVPIAAIPKPVISAFISAEDKTFYQHNGIDWKGVLRAAMVSLKNKILGRRLVGASTLTQQVAENFLVDTDQNFSLKIRKMIIATRLEKVFSKDKILELYLNEIYLGNRAYGVAAASLNYFGKSLDELSLSEMAFLAALPKGPSNYHPIRKKQRATERRNWVLGRMVANGYITEAAAQLAQQDELVSIERLTGERFEAAAYFVEAIRREVFARYGEDQLYDGGLSIRTTLDTKLQQIARTALRDSLEEYDRRHGWRGALQRIDMAAITGNPLADIERPAGIDNNWRLAVVTEVSTDNALVQFDDETSGEIPITELKWARKQLRKALLGPTVSAATQVLQTGDVVLVETVAKTPDENLYGLRQIPQINGAIMAMDPHTGRILAMVGGYSHRLSEFNRATQARRQIGSAFKPFVYSAALELGYTPVSLILDAPFIADGGANTRFYKPQNYESGAFYGLSTMRLGVEKSRNVMTVRLAQEIGMAPIVDIGTRVGIYDELSPVLAMSLGAGETTLWRLMGAYAALVNGGKLVTPTILDRVQDRLGRTIEKQDKRDCPACLVDPELFDAGLPFIEPELPEARQQVLDPITAYQMVSILEGAVQRGTGVRLRSLGKTLAGKTGTTNEMKDAWYMGFSPDLVVGVYTGFDTPSTLGRGEAGSRVALPVFKRFMEKALTNVSNAPFRIPDGVSLVWVDAKTGEIARPDAPGAILEAFQPGTEPSRADRGVRLSIGRASVADTGDTDEETAEQPEDDMLDGVY
ncbi:Multimodular transpeptidase-transglycosylase [hydrothermal vent metagenome]|uniref:Penicillin-binding protein 1A n=1 Tax=hydrothermal vent metagenome TaxID=652676 RepID=A0A3B0SKQ7_9ZZZZ